MVKPGVESSFESVSLLTVCDLSRMRVKVELNQIDVAKMRVGQRVRLRLDALPGEQFSARVTRIAAASVKTPGKDLESFPVEALLERSDPRIKPGMTADVHISVSEQSAALFLPLESVRRDGTQAFVTRVVTDPEGEHTEEVPVTLGAENDHQVEILSGLEAGERVKIDPPSAAENETKI
jgi:RND family efflux transporter MFP subunit